MPRTAKGLRCSLTCKLTGELACQALTDVTEGVQLLEKRQRSSLLSVWAFSCASSLSLIAISMPASLLRGWHDFFSPRLYTHPWNVVKNKGNQHPCSWQCRNRRYMELCRTWDLSLTTLWSWIVLLTSSNLCFISTAWQSSCEDYMTSIIYIKVEKVCGTMEALNNVYAVRLWGKSLACCSLFGLSLQYLNWREFQSCQPGQPPTIAKRITSKWVGWNEHNWKCGQVCHNPAHKKKTLHRLKGTKWLHDYTCKDEKTKHFLQISYPYSSFLWPIGRDRQTENTTQ